jgi:hypothetical protein
MPASATRIIGTRPNASRWVLKIIGLEAFPKTESPTHPWTSLLCPTELSSIRWGVSGLMPKMNLQNGGS